MFVIYKYMNSGVRVIAEFWQWHIPFVKELFTDFTYGLLKTFFFDPSVADFQPIRDTIKLTVAVTEIEAKRIYIWRRLQIR